MAIRKEMLAVALLPCGCEVDQMATVDLVPPLSSFVKDRTIAAI